MLELFAPKKTPRLEYITELVFGNVLGLQVSIREFGAGSPPGRDTNKIQLLYYKEAVEGWPWLRNNGFLEKESNTKDPSEKPYAINAGNRINAWFPEGQAEQLPAGVDLLAICFRLAVAFTEYEGIPAKSQDLRVIGNGDWRSKYEMYRDFKHRNEYRPWVHEFAAIIKTLLRSHYPDLKFKVPAFDYKITIDVDHPWKYKYKPLPIQVGGILKSMLQGSLKMAGEKVGVLFGGKDPYEVYPEIFALCPPERTWFFFLGARHSPRDNRHFFSHPRYQGLIRQIADQGYTIGIHPSYCSSTRPELIPAEKKALEKIHPPIEHSRQHYLRYTLPETFRCLEASGILHEWSFCDNLRPGFPTGLAISYPWYDLFADRKSNMILHPSMAMDRGVLNIISRDQDFNPAAPDFAEATVDEFFQPMIDMCKKWGGTFSVILHNETFSGAGEWKGWPGVIRELLSRLKQEV